MRKMMMRTGLFLERREVEGAVLVIAMTITTARVRRTHRAGRKGPGKRREQRMGRGKVRGMGRGKGRGREMGKGKVLLNKPQREMISVVPLLCSCRRKCMRQSRTRRAN
jgi:hypothetical protein